MTFAMLVLTWTAHRPRYAPIQTALSTGMYVVPTQVGLDRCAQPMCLTNLLPLSSGFGLYVMAFGAYSALLNPTTSILVQKRDPYTSNVIPTPISIQKRQETVKVHFDIGEMF